MIWLWLGFIAFVLAMLALDLGVFHRQAHVVSVKEAVTWSAAWLAMGLAFAAQEIETVPALKHDVALDFVLTEAKLFDFRSS